MQLHGEHMPLPREGEAKGSVRDLADLDRKGGSTAELQLLLMRIHVFLRNNTGEKCHVFICL